MFKFCVPSYKRANLILTEKVYKNLIVYVCESEHQLYKQNYPHLDFVAMPLGVQGNIARVRNYILDDQFSKQETCIIIDDDFSGIFIRENKESRKLTEKELELFVENGFTMAFDLGVKMWGVNIINDGLAYREYSPISFISPVLAPFTAHIKNNIRYDENIPLKEDYDFFLQHLNKYRKVLRLNKYSYICKQSNLRGGCSNMRNLAEEDKQFLLLQKKWGCDIIKRDKKNKKDYNPIVRVPIKGI